MNRDEKCHALALKLHDHITKIVDDYDIGEMIETLLGLAIGYAKLTDIDPNKAKAHMLIFINNGFRNVED